MCERKTFLYIFQALGHTNTFVKPYVIEWNFLCPGSMLSNLVVVFDS